MADDTAIQKLIESLDSEDITTVLEAIARLGDLQAFAAVPRLIDLLQSENLDVQQAAIDALGKIGDGRAVLHLSALATGDDERLNQHARDALANIDPHSDLMKSVPRGREDDESGMGEAPEPVPKPQAPPSPAPAAPPVLEEAKPGPPKAPGRGVLAPTSAEEIQFSAYYPREVPPDVWQPLQAYVFKRSAADQIAEDAEKQLGPLGAFRRILEGSRRHIAEGETITATPHLPGFQFNPPAVTVGFYEDWHRFSFKMRAADAPLNHAANGFLTFTASGIIVADVPLSVFVSTEQAGRRVQVNQTRPIYDTVFASYSHRDTHIVERVEAAAKTLGLTYLRDVISLRSGEDWNVGLLRMIDDATIFQLFWSADYAVSPHCKQEWEYAVSLKREAGSFIRPVYWQQPMPPPPAPLQHLHFAYQPDLVD